MYFRTREGSTSRVEQMKGRLGCLECPITSTPPPPQGSDILALHVIGEVKKVESGS